jgi:hypothetical protein
MHDPDLVVILRRAHFEAEYHGDHRDGVDEYQFPKIPFKADDKGHDKEIREIQQVFACLQSLHIVHDDQVEVEIDNRKDPGQLELPFLVEVKGEYKKIRRTEIHQCADIETIAEIGDDADKIGDQDQEDELVEPDHLPLLGQRIILPNPGIDDVFVKRPEGEDQRVAQKDIYF